ncbi:MAG: hypothetical protein NVS3B5_08250 [Sphingomicrobium sp.]
MNRNLPVILTVALSLAPFSIGAALAEPAVPGVAPATAQSDVPVPGVMPATANAPGSEVRLSPEQVRKVLNDASKGAKEVPVRKGAIADGRPCRTMPHGEMRMEAGTGGYGAMYGAAVVPLGCHASAAIAIETGTSNGHYSRRR